jgi:hypothetical protein
MFWNEREENNRWNEGDKKNELKKLSVGVILQFFRQTYWQTIK